MAQVISSFEQIKRLPEYELPLYFEDAATLLADTSLTTATTGQAIHTRQDGFAYKVAAADASNHHVTTAGGLKLYVQPQEGDRYNVYAFGATGDGVTDDTAAIQAAINAAPEYATIYFPTPGRQNARSWPKSYYLVSDIDDDGNCLEFARKNQIMLGSPSFRKPTLLCVERGKKIVYSQYKNVSIVGMYIYGDGDIFDGGEDSTCTGFYLRVTNDAEQKSGDYDGVIVDSFFGGCWRCADVSGRNFEYSRNLHVGFIQGLYVTPPDPDENVGNSETMRGERVFDNRFHSSAGDLWTADVTGTAQAATSTTLTLAAGDSAVNDYYRGYTITIESGTGAGQTARIIESNSTTKVVTIMDAWATTPDATSTYRIKSPHASASCIWFEPGDWSASVSYEYGHHIVNNQFDQVCRFYVGVARALNLSNNTGYNLEGGKNTDDYQGIINLIRSDFGEEVAGLVKGNVIRGVDQDANSIGIWCAARNVKIIANTITTLQRDGIRLTDQSAKCDVSGNTIDQCGGETPNTYDGIIDAGIENRIADNFITASTGNRRLRYGIHAAGIRTYLEPTNRITQEAWATAPIFINANTGSYGIARASDSDTLTMTYEVGDTKRLLSPAAGGVSQLRCTTAGTAGTLTGVTCTADTTDTIVVSSASLLRRGSYILISGDATVRRIVNVSGTTVTLSTATTASGSGLSVSFSNPVFKAEGTLAS